MHPSTRSAVRFLLCTLLISVAVGLPVIASARELIPLRLPPALLLIVIYSPTLAAVVLSTIEGGTQGLAALLRPLTIWRLPLRWYALALLLPFVINALALALFAASGHAAPSLPGDPPAQFAALAAAPMQLYLTLSAFQLLGSLGEEIGWRGYALPRLQRMNGAVRASLIIGVIWALWHTPLFLVPTSKQGLVPWEWYALYVPAVSILFTWLYNSTRGSLLPVTLLHASIQAANVYLPIIEPYGLYALSVVVTVAFAIGAVRRFGAANLTPGARVTTEAPGLLRTDRVR